MEESRRKLLNIGYFQRILMKRKRNKQVRSIELLKNDFMVIHDNFMILLKGGVSPCFTHSLVLSPFSSLVMELIVFIKLISLRIYE
jgi:hypothetical protein